MVLEGPDHGVGVDPETVKKNHDSQRRDGILPFLPRLEIGKFRHILGRFPY